MGNEAMDSGPAKIGMKETMEAFACAHAVVDAVKDMLADGKVTLLDLIKLQSVIEPARQAMEGASMIKDEFKDMDKEEAAVLFSAAWDLAFKVISAIEVKVPVPG